jgi:hypothetical protein
MLEDQIFWAYANIVFEGLVVFVLPLAFAVRELILLQRDRAAATKKPDKAGVQRGRQTLPKRARAG